MKARSRLIWVFVVIQLGCVIGAGKSLFRIDKITQQFIDKNGSARIFHGVDVLYKVPPYYPETEEWSPDNSLNERDMEDLQKWGINALRLSIMWAAIFPHNSTKANETYLAKVEEIVNRLGEHGIYTVLNLHQDLLSNMFCGEGLPDYLVKSVAPENTFPYPVRRHIKRDPDGHPNITECRNSVPIFGVFYFAEEVGRVMKQVYVGTGPDGQNSVINTDLNKLWRLVAKRFRDNEYVLGLELFNEPFAADIYSEPWGVIPAGFTGHKYLRPLYDQLHNTIRQIDDQHIVFFNPSPMDQLDSGLREGPGGPEYNDRQAFSYHIYCFILKPSGEPVLSWLCRWMDTLLMGLRMREVERIGCGGMLTEFGALDETDKSIEELNVMTGLADSYLQGWVYSMFKQYKDITTQNHGDTEGFYYMNGTLQVKKVRALTRTYAQVIAGVPREMRYDPHTSEFFLKYQIKTESHARGYTDVFLHKEYHYPHGYRYSVSPVHLPLTEVGENIIRFQHSERISIGTEISISISPVTSS